MKLRKTLAILSLLLLALPALGQSKGKKPATPPAAAPAAPAVSSKDYSGKIFEKGSKRSKELFALSVTFLDMGAEEKATGTYSDIPNKEVAMVESTVLRGDQVVKVEIEQKQLNQQATVEVRDGRAYFTLTTAGSKKTDDEAISGDFVMSGNFQRYIRSKWPALIAGKSVSFRYGVWDRLETVGFTIKKIAETGDGEQKIVTLKMSASNFFIAALVDPLEFRFSGGGERLLDLTGRVAPKLKKNGQYVDLDAEAVYYYP